MRLFFTILGGLAYASMVFAGLVILAGVGFLIKVLVDEWKRTPDGRA